ncbi:50S ribosomal protein L17 [Metamycoplasma hyosynoviae]|uniref:50S ribosomal protein L17 n=1 Tax=Metamycoplasma hyosynoviae TaxID=29559 RepID=A0AAP4AKX6_9BACT|nr:50S ribosomal protein L17 [Metamycoplasma hyosynoviae]MDC8920514.1 50S ribosomal protein L17 [Metamycoplasma hyosynoviae]MDC8921156.1 50S ribosomal protein L17 [Metamycoplasma hyosynoviae]MDD1359823.1 50S ribosomal protein L17 [Metamycoplasma hyosynoviae]MDD1366206.1 50S ribosomal protein L17 [Metamycoplasma hyosynoviae]MDD7848460.1 50S ribosomal protein L17 [Metamycoplasma hyosynoviae]
MANPKQLFRRNSEWWNHVERALVTDLLIYGEIKTTLERAKRIKPKAEKMITLGKTNTLVSRRQAIKYLIDKPAKDGKKTSVQHLFDVVAPKYTARNGGYTRIIKLVNRQGDNAKMAIIKLV